MLKFIDRYTFIARYVPAALVMIPALCAMTAWFPDQNWFGFFFGGAALSVVVAIPLAQATRDLGKKIERTLWNEWGERPTVQMLRHRDSRVPPSQKQTYHDKLAALVPIERMPTREEEDQHPDHADEIYLSCSEWLRSYALKHKAVAPFDVVHDENVSYGFRRNTLGIRNFGLVISAISAVVTGAAFFFDRQPLLALLGICIVAFWLLLVVSADWVRDAANSYAEQLLRSLLNWPTPNHD